MKSAIFFLVLSCGMASGQASTYKACGPYDYGNLMEFYRQSFPGHQFVDHCDSGTLTILEDGKPLDWQHRRQPTYIKPAARKPPAGDIVAYPLPCKSGDMQGYWCHKGDCSGPPSEKPYCFHFVKAKAVLAKPFFPEPTSPPPPKYPFSGIDIENPKPIYIQEPVTQPVAHCPEGWHVEVWHEEICVGCGTLSIPNDRFQGSRAAGYGPYLPPISITPPNPLHPDRCVRDLLDPHKASDSKKEVQR